ncbi:MAG TPA: trigger factor [Symbiobacteriaceae bacterium]
MKATWDKLEKNWMQFEVEVDADQFSKAIDTAFRTLNRRVTLPGFRRGKAPRVIFERYYGRDTLIQEALEHLLPRAYSEAVAQGGVRPIDQPQLEVVQAEEGKPLIFKGKVEVLPEVTLGRTSGLNLVKPSAEVPPEKVEEQIRLLQERMATLVTDESGEVKQGSFAVIDYEGFINGEPFEGGKGENFVLEIGSGTFVPGFEEQLVGAKSGETREITVTFPEKYHIEHLAGKEATFKVTIREVKRKELPELNDEFAKEVSRFETLEELRNDIRQRLEQVARENAEREFENQVIEAVAAEAQVDVPETLVHRQIHEMIREFEESLARQGYSLEFWSQATGKTTEDLHQEFEEPARKRVKAELVLGAVARQEGITVSEAEIDAELDQLKAIYPDQEKEIERLRKNSAYRRQLQDSILMRKTVRHLVEANTAPQG